VGTGWGLIGTYVELQWSYCGATLGGGGAVRGWKNEGKRGKNES